MFLQASSVRENPADVVGTTCNTLLCRQKSLPFALRDAKGMKYFSFFLLKKLLLSGNFFQTKQIRADTSHEVSALLVIFVFAKKYYCFYITKFKYHLFIHNLPVPIPYVVSVYGGMRPCSVILVFDDYNKLFHYTQPCAVPYNRISMPVSFQSPP